MGELKKISAAAILDVTGITRYQFDLLIKRKLITVPTALPGARPAYTLEQANAIIELIKKEYRKGQK